MELTRTWVRLTDAVYIEKSFDARAGDGNLTERHATSVLLFALLSLADADV